MKDEWAFCPRGKVGEPPNVGCDASKFEFAADSAYEFSRGDGGIMAAEAEGVADDSIELRLPGGVRDVVEIALRIGNLIIDCGRDNAGFQGFGANGHFDSTSAEHMAG